MPVTPEQAQMLTSLALDCRPHGAARWHEPGTMAAVKRIRHWSLHEAIHEVIAAAADRTAETPGVIGKAGNHRKTAGKPPEVPRVSYDPRKTCAVCFERRESCRGSDPNDGHAFVPVERKRQPSERPDDVVVVRDGLCRHGVPPLNCAEHKPQPIKPAPIEETADAEL